jgi:hypothetical protein
MAFLDTRASLLVAELGCCVSVNLHRCEKPTLWQRYITRLGQNHIYIRCTHGISGRERPNIRSYTVHIYGSGKPNPDVTLPEICLCVFVRVYGRPALLRFHPHTHKEALE